MVRFAVLAAVVAGASAFRATTMAPDMGSCVDIPEPPCFDAGISDNEAACNMTPGCLWTADPLGPGPGSGGGSGGGGMCAVESCFSQTSRSDCVAFTTHLGSSCVWMAANEMCVEEGLGGIGSGSGSGGSGGLGGPGDVSPCFGFSDNQAACEAAGCFYQAPAGSGIVNIASCEPQSCFTQQDAASCRNFDSDSGDCQWDAVAEMCMDDASGGPGGGPGGGSGSGIGGPGGGPGDASPCYSMEAGASQAACENMDETCVWTEYDMGSGAAGSGSPTSGTCEIESCFTQRSSSDCTSYSNDCRWDSMTNFCENTTDTGTGGDGCGSGIGSPGAPGMPGSGCGNSGGNGAVSPCLDINIMDEASCTAVSGAQCEWENSFGSGLGGGGFCVEVSCGSMDTQADCIGFSGGDCRWVELGGLGGPGSGASEYYCTDASSVPDSTDDPFGSGSVACTNYNSRQQCRANGCMWNPATTMMMTTTIMPTTTEPAAVTSASPGTCPANCGQPENGGGSCRPNGKCLTCNRDRIRLTPRGVCLRTINCRARKVLTGRYVNDSCSCEDENCHYCVRTAEGDTCRKCRNGFYFLNDACVESCPANMASSGVNQFGRRCSDPFTCIGGRVNVTPAVSYGCKCATSDNRQALCHICEHRAGEFGQHCTRCKGGKFLYNYNCIDNCDGIPNVVEYNAGSFGRECRPAFTCTNREDEQGNPCKCARSVGKHDCVSCDYAPGGVTCTRCGNNMYLRQGRCVRECPDTETPTGSAREGRECIP